VFAVMRAGARGYVLKGAEQEEIVGAIHAVSRGGAVFGPGVAQRFLHPWQAAGGRPLEGDRAGAPVGTWTGRQGGRIWGNSGSI
jgi:DNA-binding NarL/FixJ family response regulator